MLTDNEEPEYLGYLFKGTKVVNGQSVDPSDFFTIGRQMSVAGELRQSTLIN